MAVKQWLDFQRKKHSVNTGDRRMDLLNMAVTGIVNAEDVPEPPYPDVMDIYYRMKMIGFRFWGDGLDSQPYVLYYEMQIVNTLLETFEKVNSKAQYESLLKGLTNAK